MQYDGLINRFLLSFLGAAAKQNDQRLALFGQVETIAWPPVDLVLADPPEPFDIRSVAQFNPNLGDRDLGGGLGIQSVEPVLIGVVAVFADVFFKMELHDNGW